MILKLMMYQEPDKLMLDNDPDKPCRLIDDVGELHATTMETGEAVLHVEYRTPHRQSMSESFVLSAMAYLMNDNGKTIQSFQPAKPTTLTKTPETKPVYFYPSSSQLKFLHDAVNASSGWISQDLIGSMGDGPAFQELINVGLVEEKPGHGPCRYRVTPEHFHKFKL